MKGLKAALLPGLSVVLSVLGLTVSGASYACGGFFCQLTPINQAAEQIVFRQDDDLITAMIQIQFAGNAEDFSWVVPVPSTPEFELGSNQAFTDLERITRPQFNLERTGTECAFRDFNTGFPTAESESVSVEDADGGVTVESVQDVGGYEVAVISGDNVESITQWLSDNNYDLGTQGEALLTPYVEEGMMFVAAKLQQNRGLGSIQPLIMKYRSDKPVVPIRLTAVAAMEDMGVLVWLLGDARAVPENYLHVTPNYTRLNWFSGPFNAYSSYQSLITDAMNEAGGQGFATDYAGRFEGLLDAMTSPDDLADQLTRLDSSPDTEFLSLVQNILPGATVVADLLTELLPLPAGQTVFSYFDQSFLATNYTAAELAAARSAIDAAVREEVIAPLQLSLDVLGDNRYMTRLFTTLSADEMTLDPAFVFNAEMPDQSIERNATLDAACVDDQTHWTLKLGAGTGRTDEVVIETIGPVPFAATAVQQDAVWRTEETAALGAPLVVEQRQFQIASLGSPVGNTDTGSGSESGGGNSGGGGGAPLIALAALLLLRRRQVQ